MPYPGRRNFLLSGARFVGAYDAIPNLMHVYEPARRTLTSYTGALGQLLRDSDNAESDWGYLGDGELDNASIATWLGGSAGYWKTIYDQKGSDHITQTTKANMPLYVASAQNGHAGMSFNGTHRLQGEFTIGLSQPFNVYAIAQLDALVVDDGISRFVVSGDDTTNRADFLKISAAGIDNFAIYAGSVLSGNDANANWNIWAALFNGVSSQLWLNGVSDAGPGNAGANNLDGLTIGTLAAGAGAWKGFIVSVVIAEPSHSDAQRQAMEAAMNSYWAVY